MAEAYSGRVSQSGSTATRKRGDNLELISKRAPPSLCLASLPAPTMDKPASARPSSTHSSPDINPSSAGAAAGGGGAAAPATSRRFSLFGARRQKRTMSCAVEMTSSGSSSFGLGSMTADGGDMTNWEDFQKRYRVLGLDEEGGGGSEHDVGRDLLQPATARGRDKSKEKGSGSRGRRNQHHDATLQLLSMSVGSNGSSPHASPLASPRGSMADRDMINGKREKEKTEKKEKKKAEKEKKKDKKDKKEKQKDKKEKKDKKDKKEKKKSKDTNAESSDDASEEKGATKSVKSGSTIESGDGSPSDGKKSSRDGEKRGLTLRARMGMRLGSYDLPVRSTEKDKRDSPLLNTMPVNRVHEVEDDDVPMSAGSRRRQASSPARVQVGRWERRTFHSGEMGGNDAVLSQLLKMAENIKKGQDSLDDLHMGGLSRRDKDEDIDFANQEAEVRKVVRAEELLRLDEAIARLRRKLKKVDSRIRKTERKLSKKRGTAGLSRSGRIAPDITISSADVKSS